MADCVTLVKDNRGRHPRWIANFKGIVAAELTAEITADTAILHNRVHLWNKTLCREYIAIYGRVREQLKERGIRLVMVCSDHYTEKMGRYWRLMGFKVFYNAPAGEHGEIIPCAVMEV